ncbi:hypothetical protein GCM10027277_20730 [Pseudoduganella ginsengisoli]|uniref:DUF3649 domain-containing protein n=1 Tax=Pseudoduganella ginsengisoli TaxID=1462440 RepID=A0A6L6PVJ3_9BURK|nr:DUF3649 domain-containing protein [Pseudoduganella ginsengisoli]MTW00672.1 DUF3649 domain-containing protein [Pseudoduganella ginsengisoli]
MPRSPLAIAVSRACAALIGGYAFAATSSALLATCLPLTRADAVVAATLLSFALYAAAALRAFAAPSAWRAWGELLLPAAAMALAVKGLA